jgi:hypothetical protein
MTMKSHAMNPAVLAEAGVLTRLLLSKRFMALLALVFVVGFLATGTASPVQANSGGGPVILMGIDAEDGVRLSPPRHGDPSIYAGIIQRGIMGNIGAGRSGILAIGCGKSATDDVTSFWSAVASLLGQTLTCVNGATAITSVPIPSTLALIAVVSDVMNTPSGGLTQEELNALNGRASDIARHINGGGGLFGLSNCALTNPYNYLGGIGGFTCGTVFVNDVEPTPEGAALGITSTNLDVCCWHDSYLVFPSFLRVLAIYPGVSGGPPAAIGGQQVVIPGLTLSPSTATNPVGTTHTVTAAVTQTVGGSISPVAGVTVNFTVSGANTASGSCVTGTNGQCTFTYRGANEGTDTIRATATVAGQQLTAEVTKTWIRPPTPQGRMTGGGSVVSAVSGQRVTHGFELYCDPAQGPNNLQVNWGDQRFHLEGIVAARCTDDRSIDPGQPVAPFDTYQGRGIGSYKRGSGPWQTANVEWTFTDAGEPGQGRDLAEIRITVVGTNEEVLNVRGFLDGGNQQAHPPQ